MSAVKVYTLSALSCVAKPLFQYLILYRYAHLEMGGRRRAVNKESATGNFRWSLSTAIFHAKIIDLSFNVKHSDKQARDPVPLPSLIGRRFYAFTISVF